MSKCFDFGASWHGHSFYGSNWTRSTGKRDIAGLGTLNFDDYPTNDMLDDRDGKIGVMEFKEKINDNLDESFANIIDNEFSV